MLSHNCAPAYIAFRRISVDGSRAPAAAPNVLELCMNVAKTVAAIVLVLAGSAAAQDGGKAIPKTTISLGTATPGGGFPLYGNAFAEIMNGADPTLSIEPCNDTGSTENI